MGTSREDWNEAEGVRPEPDAQRQDLGHVTLGEGEPVCVVGVGASAGGLEALEQFFGAMPEKTGLAFIVVQHLSPDFKSVMDELLARRTRIPVLMVEDGMRVEPDHIYLIPSKKEMIIAGGTLLLSDKGTTGELTLPVDVFFRALAQDFGPRAVGVILSGAGSDGARGIRDIHAAGGLVLSQDTSADFDGMPRSARETGCVDHVLPPAEMPAVLVAHAQNSPNEPRGASARPYGMGAAFRFLQKTYGIDFSHYKPSTVVRRIERRLQLAQAPNLDAYIERLANDAEELDALFRDLLIGVTRFFRDEEAFEFLDQEVIPELLEREPKQDEIRVWVAGCATGEEAYSIAILLLERMRETNDRRRLKILATDIHPGSLEFAARGLYDEERMTGMRSDLRDRYFDKVGAMYQVSTELRQLIVFAPHNVVKDAPFTRLDLISCRNMLIYLQPVAQKRVLGLLHFALKRHGVLFLGPSENVGALADDFESLEPRWRIYRKQRDVRPPADTRIPAPHRAMRTGQNGTGVRGGYSLSQLMSVYDALLDQQLPPSMLVTERRELLHTFGGMSRYFTMRDGRPSRDVLELVAPDLKLALAGAVQRALKEHTTVSYDGLPLDVRGSKKNHHLSVRPLVTPTAPQNHLFISIKETGEVPPDVAESQLDVGQISLDRLSALEAELSRTKESLQATIEELETSNEELQSANEELLASNEELQSTNEELQSVNEELYTVNAEYQKKISELTRLTNDMDNLLASTEVGTVFLDEKLTIRKFTPRVAEIFELLPGDIGRPIASFTSTLDYGELSQDLARVLGTGQPVEREVRARSGSWYFLRILPYSARGQIDGVVLTLIEINALKSAEDAVFRERYLLNSLMDNVPDDIYFRDAEGRFVRINRAMARRFGLESSDQAVGKTTSDFLPVHGRILDDLDRAVLGGDPQPYHVESQPQKNGEPAWFMTTRQPLADRDGNVVGMLGVARDVTQEKRADDEIRLAVKRRDEFLAMLSHELRNPLAAIVSAAVLLESYPDDAKFITKSIGVINRQSQQMTRLLDDLLEVTRITQNKIELRKSVLDIRAVASEAIVAVRDKFQTRQIELKTSLDDAELRVDADPARLQQVLVNLLDNSSKYNRSGGHAWLTLSREGDQVVIRVKDDGVGIEPSLRQSIFEPFVQGNQTLHRNERGMGVGLSVVRSLVEMHGGKVEFHSDGKDQGCEFTVKLPRVVQAIGEPVARQPVPWPTGKRVAVVEDNHDGREMLQLLLQRSGYEVFTAADGKSGLELIERLSPDIAIVDIGLPIMDGFELARHLRSSPKHQALYLVALTGYGQAADHTAALEAGFDEHLVKPLDPDELTRWLKADA